MDWSLVLASQDIEAIIDHAEDSSGWGLIIAEQDLGKAIETLQLYLTENRRWGWRRQILRPGLLFDWTSLLWVVLLCLFFWLSQTDPALVAAGVMNGVKVGAGQWWRLFTAMWLHANAAHLAANATMGLVLLGLAMGRYGAGIGLVASYLAGLGGNLLVWLLAPQTLSLGASGAVMGSLGLLAAQSFSWRPRTPRDTRLFLTGLLGGVMLFVLFGLDPSADVRAHLGGFVTGLLLGAALNLLLPHAAQKPWLNIISGLLFLPLVIWPWWQALLHR